MESTTEATTIEATSEPLGPDPNHPNRVTVERLKVLHDYLVIRPLAVPSKLGGSLIHMAETATERERSHRGIVLACGPGDFNEPGTALVPMTINPGDLVFFGKYAGTEERIGPDVVLVMRESECRFCVPDGCYELVTHDDPRQDHLVEDYCEICHGIPLEQAAKERLAFEREAQQLGLKTACVCGHLGDRHAHGTASCRDCDCKEFRAEAPDAPFPSAPLEFPIVVDPRQRDLANVNEQLVDLAKRGKLQPPLATTTMIALTDDKRPCVEPGCLLMQRHMASEDGHTWWIGLRCGHVSPGEGA